MSMFKTLAKTNAEEFKKARRALELENRKFSDKFELVHEIEAKLEPGEKRPIKGWRNRHFLAAIYFENNESVRLTINRSKVDSDGNWVGDITWDELMAVKQGIGMSNVWMVEIFPPDSEVVNVANLRHLWITGEPAFAWSKAKKSSNMNPKAGLISKAIGFLKGAK